MISDPLVGPESNLPREDSISKTAPVHGSPLDPDQPEPGIALCLSGGGYRAMLFHLGALWRLNECGVLDQLKRVSSVSGGSITAGVLGAYWSTRRAGPAAWFQDEVVKRIREMARTTIDWQSVLEGKIPLAGSVAEHIASHYDKHLFQGMTLQNLPDNPRFVINATSLQSGVLWRFSKPYMGDWKVGRFANPRTKLSLAVAASSAFPPFLSPANVSLDDETYIKDPQNPALLSDPKYRKKAVLTDGGVYDNLGLETAFKRYDTLLVSDGGAALGSETSPHTEWALLAYRVLNVIDNQVGALRKRLLIACYDNSIRKGAYWGIRTDIANYGLGDSLYCDPDLTTKLAATPTRLAALDDTTQESLIDWGYAVCDAAIRKHFPQPNLAAPQTSPFRHFRQRTLA